MILTEKQREYILSNPYNCDECFDLYNKEDLYKVDNKYNCKNCLEFK